MSKGLCLKQDPINIFEPSSLLQFDTSFWDDGTDLELGEKPKPKLRLPAEGVADTSIPSVEEQVNFWGCDYYMSNGPDEKYVSNSPIRVGLIDVEDYLGSHHQTTLLHVADDICEAVPWYDYYNGVSAGSQNGFSHQHRQSKIRNTRAGKHRQQFSLEDLAT